MDRRAGVIEALASSELPEGEGRQLVLEGRSVALFRHGDRVFALDGICPHAGSPLGPGAVEDGMVSCPWHGFRFRLEDGWSPDMGGVCQPTYRVEEREGRIWIALPEGANAR
jgi:pyruvate oxidase